jgi:hypothetical protein
MTTPLCRACDRALHFTPIVAIPIAINGFCPTCAPRFAHRFPPDIGSICNADLGHPCDADDGEPCPRCAESEREWQREWDRTPESVRRLEMMTQEELNQELRDAGRGHLVRS